MQSRQRVAVRPRYMHTRGATDVDLHYVAAAAMSVLLRPLQQFWCYQSDKAQHRLVYRECTGARMEDSQNHILQRSANCADRQPQKYISIFG
jgi:hypothetical protein